MSPAYIIGLIETSSLLEEEKAFWKRKPPCGYMEAFSSRSLTFNKHCAMNVHVKLVNQIYK